MNIFHEDGDKDDDDDDDDNDDDDDGKAYIYEITDERFIDFSKLTVFQWKRQTRSCLVKSQVVFSQCMVYKNEPNSVKMGINTFAKSIDPCQPAQSAQADMNRNFLQAFFFGVPIYMCWLLN